MAQDETVYRPEVIPAVCGNGHTTYSASFMTMHDNSVVTLQTDSRVPSCPVCGADRVLPAGRYEVDPEGKVFRAGDAH
jgi:hypothetical protein